MMPPLLCIPVPHWAAQLSRFLRSRREPVSVRKRSVRPSLFSRNAARMTCSSWMNRYPHEMQAQ